MGEGEVLAYVKATAALLDLPLDEARALAVALHLGRTAAMARMLDAARAQAVAQHLARTAAMAALLDEAGLAPQDEPAEVYRPAPFPAEDA